MKTGAKKPMSKKEMERRERNRKSAAEYRVKQRQLMQFWRTSAESACRQLCMVHAELSHERSRRIQLELVLQNLARAGRPLNADACSPIAGQHVWLPAPAAAAPFPGRGIVESPVAVPAPPLDDEEDAEASLAALQELLDSKQ